MKATKKTLTSSHWGIGLVEAIDGQIINVLPYKNDPAPSKLNSNIPASTQGNARVLKPAFRKSWLLNGPGDTTTERGKDVFVELDWDEALDRIAKELSRVREQHGNESIFAGSYGWASAGRFHHAQSQLKRFLNTQGGFVTSEGNYSYNAALVFMPHIVGNFRESIAQATRWSVIAKHSKRVICFGGVPIRNGQISDGGIHKHRLPENLKACADAGIKFINISPLRSDLMPDLSAEWLPAHPGTDTALMMGIAHTLLSEGLHDQSFLDRYTVGFSKVATYLTGKLDGSPKTAEWAERMSGISAERIRKLAREMSEDRTMISIAAGLQRGDYGEQPLWMAVTLAAMLGQVGLPGGGYTIAYGVNGNVGNIERLFRAGAFSQGENPVETFIPVAMISDLLLNPGGKYHYDGKEYTFPDIKMVWWAGGNPFHHHQDLNRLRKAFQKPDTIIVNEMNWTSTARHADIILPIAGPQERTDFGAGKSDNALVPMPKAIEPVGSSITEYEIYSRLGERLGNVEDFTEGKTADEWLSELWEVTRTNGQAFGVTLPNWNEFITGDIIAIPDPSPNQVFLSEFRADPIANPLKTPSGKIELYSETIASFGLGDCPGHAAWFPPRDLEMGLKAKYPLYLLSGQPGTRLHSQFDNGEFSISQKINGREPVLIHPDDASERDILNGGIVEMFNERGACLAGARVTKKIAKGNIFLCTGAWYDPDFDAPKDRDRHGNPNVLTHDNKTSNLSQSPAAHSALVQIRNFEGKIPNITVHEQPKFASLENREKT